MPENVPNKEEVAAPLPAVDLTTMPVTGAASFSDRIATGIVNRLLERFLTPDLFARLIDQFFVMLHKAAAASGNVANDTFVTRVQADFDKAALSRDLADWVASVIMPFLQASMSTLTSLPSNDAALYATILHAVEQRLELTRLRVISSQ